MIDTLKFVVRLSEEQLKLVNEKCSILQKTRQNDTIFKIVTDDMKLGSYERNVHIRVEGFSKVSFEFSAPKYLYGHNVLLLYPSQLEMTLAKLHQDFESYFGSFPPYEQWSLYRLDICYAWRLQDQHEVHRVMTLLQSFAYPRKKPYKRDTSIMFIGSAYTVKFYEKQPEVKEHDYKHFLKVNPTMAEKIMVMSEGVLRFEAGLKRPAIIALFGETATYLDIIYKDTVLQQLQFYLKKYFSYLEMQLMTTNEIYTKLMETFDKTRAVQLFQFYVTYFTEKSIHRKLLIDGYSRAQIQKNLKNIRKAKIGLPKESMKISFDFNIPSLDVVNEDCSKPGGGEQSSLSGNISNTHSMTRTGANLSSVKI